MRATTQGGGGMPLLIVLKWEEHNEEGVCAPLLVASKRKLEHDHCGTQGVGNLYEKEWIVKKTMDNIVI